MIPESSESFRSAVWQLLDYDLRTVWEHQDVSPDIILLFQILRELKKPNDKKGAHDDIFYNS